jgi:hypothetical protein
MILTGMGPVVEMKTNAAKLLPSYAFFVLLAKNVHRMSKLFF